MTEPPSFQPPFAGYQAEIFLRGMAGEAPEHPISLGLAVGGEQGVLGVLRSVLAELDLTIGLTGHIRPVVSER